MHAGTAVGNGRGTRGGRRDGRDAGATVGGHHPAGEDEGEAGEAFPFLAEVELVGVLGGGGGGADDFVADQQQGRRIVAGFGQVACGQGDDGGGGVVEFAEDELGEDDGGVGVGVAVEGGDFFRGDL